MKNTYPILYSFRRCPYAMRARMALYYAGIDVELREVDLKNKPPALLEASPKGTVPVLRLTDGTVIDESLDIINWAVNQNDPNDWLNTSPESVDSYNREILEIFVPALKIYKYPDRHEDKDPDTARHVCENYLTDLNARLVKNSGYLAGHNMSKADIIVFPFVRQFRLVDEVIFDNLPLPALHRWFSEFYRSDIYNNVMERYTVWQDGDTPIILTAGEA